ncbi:YbaB/EbfC family nucleoid-associated protein [Saprospira sp. CCB-QB6]|uniref:YbaB/EbfC family nucleoid-associated protein n=1 Tax=Saprospira sp. CCB-QB6 TaxID=3023936 RepID=UPI0023493BAA|nr:YbaB/EbfC family nucleoid-associated protein [Saprospira sp. CCB-QB6]WCL81225.1 YbaB/EbfC family nucleoid-associated protein [Saprospira sp. CCB-QB6]
MFGNIQEQQEKMRQRLTQIEVSAQAGGGAIQIRANAARQILDIKIDPELSLDDHEELEDLLLTAMNRVLAAAAEKEAAETESMLKDILPPGMGDLGGMFGF